MTSAVGAAPLPHALTALPTAGAVAVLCALVIAEIVCVPGVVLPGGTVTLMAGVLIGSGRPAVPVAGPLAAAVVCGDHLAYVTGGAIIGWWRRRRPGRLAPEQPSRRGWVMKWLAAAVPAVAGAARMPYRSFAPRLLVLRVPWLAVLLAAGALAARSFGAVGRIAGIAGLVASVVVAAVLLAVHARLPVRAIARRRGVRLAGLVLLTAGAGWVCGGVLQDSAANEETVHLNPRVGALLASHVPPDAAHSAVSVSHLVQPPGLWFIAAMVIMFLDVARRGRSTVRFVTVTAAGLAAAGLLDTVLPAVAGNRPVSLGACLLAALAVSLAVFACRWLGPARAGFAVAAIAVTAAGFALALAVAGYPFTALVAGASLGVAVAGSVEAATRLRWGSRWLGDRPPRAPAAA